MKKQGQTETILIVLGVVLGLILLIGCFYVIPIYKVWAAGKAGEAELKKAEQNRQIAIEEARARMEAAKMLAEAEVERAKGVAEANKIIGDSLEGNDLYLRYLWVNTLAEAGGNRQIIYVPTEAQLPILEAGRGLH